VLRPFQKGKLIVLWCLERKTAPPAGARPRFLNIACLPFLLNLRSFCSHLETAALELTDYDYGMAYGLNTYTIVHVVFHSRMS
jgi:hypothetical protein